MSSHTVGLARVNTPGRGVVLTPGGTAVRLQRRRDGRRGGGVCLGRRRRPVVFSSGGKGCGRHRSWVAASSPARAGGDGGAAAVCSTPSSMAVVAHESAAGGGSSCALVWLGWLVNGKGAVRGRQGCLPDSPSPRFGGARSGVSGGCSTAGRRRFPCPDLAAGRSCHRNLFGAERGGLCCPFTC